MVKVAITGYKLGRRSTELIHYAEVVVDAYNELINSIDQDSREPAVDRLLDILKLAEHSEIVLLSSYAEIIRESVERWWMTRNRNIYVYTEAVPKHVVEYVPMFVMYINILAESDCERMRGLIGATFTCMAEWVSHLTDEECARMYEECCEFEVMCKVVQGRQHYDDDQADIRQMLSNQLDDIARNVHQSLSYSGIDKVLGWISNLTTSYPSTAQSPFFEDVAKHLN